MAPFALSLQMTALLAAPMSRVCSRGLALVAARNARCAFWSFFELKYVRRLSTPVLVSRGLEGASWRCMILEMPYLNPVSKVIGPVVPAIDTDE